MKPLDGIIVLECCQYLAGPLAGLRLADMGAYVIKIERPTIGEAGRHLAIRDGWAADGSSQLFHTLNRNKESYCADLKTPEGLLAIQRLIRQADVLLHNFMPGVMDRLGLGYEDARRLNDGLIYVEISGYGPDGPWAGKPGQDLLVQAVSGLTLTTGSADDTPVPFGLAIADYLTANHAVQGILAALYRREQTGAGTRLQLSLLESLLDFQFELLTTYYRTGQQPQRSTVRNAHPLLSAPYGLYPTADGYLALAMMPIHRLLSVIDFPKPWVWEDQDRFEQRDAIKMALTNHFSKQPTVYWLDRLVAADLWAMPVLDWSILRQTDSYAQLAMEQRLTNGLQTTRCPIRFNGQVLKSDRPAPKLGAHNESINQQFTINESSVFSSIPESAYPGDTTATSSNNDARVALLQNLLIVDFSQFLSGPSAGLRLADLGARVIKIERLNSGDICRQLYVSDVSVEGESTIFHAINRNKESYCADLKSPADWQKIRQLISRADVLIHNFRPGVMEKLGLAYEQIESSNPSLIYADISGYGDTGNWRNRPGQDLLVQAVSGLTHLTGNRTDPPMPMGVAVADILAGTHLVQGILAALRNRGLTGQGSHVQVSLLESALDYQVEVLTAYLNDGHRPPDRGATNSGHAYLAAPYGIYPTLDGFIALSITPLARLATLLNSTELTRYKRADEWFSRRDEIRSLVALQIKTRTTTDWLAQLEPAGIWCADVLDYDRLTQHPAYQILAMEQNVRLGNGTLRTTRCPIRVDGQRLTSSVGAPRLGEHTLAIDQEFNLNGV